MSQPRATAKEATAKAQMIAILADQPDDSSFDDLLRELAFNRMVIRGLAHVEDGSTIGTDELRRRVKGWRR